jgi:predicted aspartyl protease
MLALLGACGFAAGALGAPGASGDAPLTGAADELSEISVEASGPRFVAPTLRDRIGRIWAPVFINGRGPFRLVLDTGATQSGVTAEVAAALGVRLDQAPAMLLRGVTGSVRVPAIHVESLNVGELTLSPADLPIVPDAMGGAEGVLGTTGLTDKRISIDFRNDRISIVFSRGDRARAGFTRIPFRFWRGKLIMVDATVGTVPVKAIIDTGGQMSIANLALRDALARRRAYRKVMSDQIIGATLDVQDGEIIDTPAIAIGGIEIRDRGVTYSDVFIFSHWDLLGRPAILIGMDALGLLDTLIIDYRRRELQLKTAAGG